MKIPRGKALIKLCISASMRQCIFFLFIFCFSLFTLTGCMKSAPKTHVQLAAWGSKSEMAIVKPILVQFELENPDIKVDLIHIPQKYFQKIHLLFASNLAPDVIFMNNLYLPIYANAEVLEELGRGEEAKRQGAKERMISASLRGAGLSGDEAIQEIHYSLFPFPPSLFYAKSLESLSYDGKLYAIPRDVSTLVVYYNKDLFNKYNVPLPSQYWSFSDFLVLAKKLTKDTNSDGKPDIWGVGFEEDLLYWLPFLMSEGGGVLSEDLKTSIIDTPQSQKGLRFYADLRKKYHVAPTEAESASATMAQLFLQGKLAMQISGRWLVPKYREDAKFDWNVINFPAGDKGSIVPLDASGWSIAKSSRHKDEAMRLIKYLSSKKSIEKFCKSGLIVPARIDVAQGEFVNDTRPPKNSNVFIDVIKNSKNTPVSIKYDEIQDDLKEKTNYIFN